MNKIKVLLIMIMMLFITGCYNYDMEMKINDDKSMDFTLINTIDTSKFDNNDSGEVTTGSAALSTANAEFEKYNKNLKPKGYNVEKYSDPNNSSITGMKITKKFDSIDYISKEGEPTRVNLSKIGEEDYDDSFLFTVKKGLVYNTYTATFVFGNEDANSSENAQIQNYESQMNVTYRVSLPVPAFSSNSNVINDDGKTLSWTLKPSEVNIVEYSFKIADQMNLYLAYGSAGLIILLIIIAISVNIGNYRRKKQSIPKQPKEPKKSKEPKQIKEKIKKDKEGNVVNLMAPQEALTNENQNINLIAPQEALTNDNQMPASTVIESPKPLHSEDGPAVIINAPAVTIEANGSNNSNPVLEQSQPVMEDNQSNETTIDNNQLQMPDVKAPSIMENINNVDQNITLQGVNNEIVNAPQETVLDSIPKIEEEVKAVVEKPTDVFNVEPENTVPTIIAPKDTTVIEESAIGEVSYEEVKATIEQPNIEIKEEPKIEVQPIEDNNNKIADIEEVKLVIPEANESETNNLTIPENNEEKRVSDVVESPVEEIVQSQEQLSHDNEDDEVVQIIEDEDDIIENNSTNYTETNIIDKQDVIETQPSTQPVLENNPANIQNSNMDIFGQQQVQTPTVDEFANQQIAIPNNNVEDNFSVTEDVQNTVSENIQLVVPAMEVPNEQSQEQIVDALNNNNRVEIPVVQNVEPNMEMGAHESIENNVLEQSQPVMEDNQSNETTIDNSQLQIPNMENQIQETVANNLSGDVPVMQNVQANMGIHEPIENTVLEQPQSVMEPELENVQPETSNQSQVIVPSVDEMFENANKTIDAPQQQIENNKEVGTMEYNFDFNNQTINSQLQNNENNFVSTTNVTPVQDFTNVFDSNPVMEAPNIAAFENTRPQEQVINTINVNTQVEVPVQNVEPTMEIQEPIENTVLDQPQTVIEPISQDIQIDEIEANNNQLQMSNMETLIQEPVVNNLSGEVPVMQNLQPNMEIEIEKIQEPLENPILDQTQIEIPNAEPIDLKNEQQISNVVIPNVDISLPEVQINDQAVIPEFKPVNQIIEPISMPETIQIEVPSNNNENKIEMPILPDIPDTDPGMEESKHRYITNVQIPTPDEDTIISDIVSEPTE
ncbi:MAG: hypothetical protein PUA68_00165 [Bacilli bacterium]|nr:hypothetical protein [Bacilli bacterium]